MKGIIEEPKGLVYRPDFITEPEEQGLLKFVRQLEFYQVVMHGVPAKRVTRHYGYSYDYQTWKVVKGERFPTELEIFRARAEKFAGLAAGEFKELLVTKYPPGASIGWHRDAAAFGGIIVGISLLSPCIMRFARREAGERYVYERILNPRSAYILSGDARYVWQHHIPVAKAERYSLTFRQLASK